MAGKTTFKSEKIFAGRVTSIDEIPIVRTSGTKTLDERVAIANERLQSNASRPRTMKTLTSTLIAHFQKSLSDKEVAEVIERLVADRVVALEGTKVSYLAATERPAQS
jgi:hypothetical protein